MSRHDTGNLIDFDDSPLASGTTTPSALISPRTATSQPHTTNSPHASKPSSPPPHPPLAHAATTSASGYGLGSAVWGLFRRISTVDSAAASTPSSHLQHPPHATGDGVSGAFTPPRRAATPRGLPSLDPVSLHGYRGDTTADERLLARGVAEEIRTFLPERLKIMEDWRLVYSLYQNGSSLGTLYQLCEKYRGVRAGFVLVVRDGRDGVCFRPFPLFIFSFFFVLLVMC